MQFYRLDEVPVSRDDRVFKESPLRNAIAPLIVYGLVAVCVYYGFKSHKSGGITIVPLIFAAVFALFGLIPLRFFLATFKPTNWLLRCNLTGIIVKYRAYENWKLPSDSPQAVAIEYGEIASARLVKERRTSPAMDAQRGNQTEFLTYIDLALAKADTTELEARLDAERNLRPEGTMIVCDYPVQVLPGGIVEIRWGAGLRPSAKKALEALGSRVKILETEHRVTDLTFHRGANANPADHEAKILALAKSGDEIGAAQLARQVHGYSLSEATGYVDQLLGKSDD